MTKEEPADPKLERMQEEATEASLSWACFYKRCLSFWWPKPSQKLGRSVVGHVPGIHESTRFPAVLPMSYRITIRLTEVATG